MRISLFSPYGPYSQESGVIYLLGNYLRELFPDVVQLKCNGLFSICERDSESNWKRDFDSCMLCMADQAHLQKWSGLHSIDGSKYVAATDIEMSGRWLQEIEDSELLEATFQGEKVFELCNDSFQKRLGSPFDANNKKHVQVARRMIITVVRTLQMTQAFQNEFAPDMCFVAGGKDLISSAFVRALSGSHAETVEFRWDMHKRSIKIQRASADEAIACDLLLEGVSNMRSDKRTWPREFTQIIDEILDYLDLKHTQLSLPIGMQQAV